MCMCLCESMLHVWVTEGARRGNRFPGARVSGDYELTDMGSGN